MIEITPEAESFLAELLQDEGPEVRVRMFVHRPGTSHAETELALCEPHEQQPDDVEQRFEGFTMVLDRRSAPYLEDASIDLRKSGGEVELVVTAPKVRDLPVADDAPLSDRVQYLLDAEINPALAAHGGMVDLVRITDEGTALLRFGGGCTGCAQVDVTLQQGVERSLMEHFAGELRGVADATDHSTGENPYFRRA